MRQPVTTSSEAPASGQDREDGPVSHPLGVQPEGNAHLLAVAPRAAIAKSLGPHFGSLQDSQLLSLFGFFDADGLRRIALCSKALYMFSRDDELWRGLTLAKYGSSFIFTDSWRLTYNKTEWSVEQDCALERSVPTTRDIVNRKVVQVRGMFSDVLTHKWRCQTASIDQSWLEFDNVRREHASEFSVDAFRDCYEAPGIPVVIQGVANTWEASRLWSKESFQERFGEIRFNAGGFEFPLDRYLAYADAVVGRCDQPLYLFDCGFAKKAPELAAEYSVPAYFDEDLFQHLRGPNMRPDYRWLIVGPRNSGSTFHKDPNATSAWNACVRGSKKWILFPPDCPPPGVFPNESGSDVTAPVSVLEWFINYYEEARRVGSVCGSYECVVGEGDIVFVPSGWWHVVLNLEWSIAITQNYVSRSNFARVADWMSARPDQVSGCRCPDHAHQVAQNFYDDVVAARPELAFRNPRNGADDTNPGSRLSKRRKLGSSRPWKDLQVISAKGAPEGTESNAVEAVPFSFGIG